jgi:hypothetical protein
MGTGLGRRQRRIIGTMRWQQGGIWPWAIHRDDLRSFDGLVERGLIEPVTIRRGTDEVPTYRLTARGVSGNAHHS